MTKFIQTVEFTTRHIDEVQTLAEKFDAERAANSAVRPHVLLVADRDRPNVYQSIVEFPSYEIAMENSNRPETSEFAARMGELCDGPPKFYNLDLVTEM